LYVLCAALALLGARMDPHGRDRMLELLAADVLWVQGPQVLMLALAAVLLWVALWMRPHLLGQDTPFYIGFALVISVAVPVLGLFVVFAFLIGPALWLRASPQAPSLHALRAPLALAFGACALGLAASWWWDAPSGACVALACALVGLAAALRRT
jgi:zinc/manganese transport system permease protein